MAFNYEAQTDTPDDVIRRIAAEMSGGGLKPPSEGEQLEREIRRAQRAVTMKQNGLLFRHGHSPVTV
jgi:hypothetical protein